METDLYKRIIHGIHFNVRLRTTGVGGSAGIHERDIDNAEREIAYVLAQLGIISSETFGWMRAALEISSEQAAQFMGVSAGQILRWEKHEAPLPHLAWKLLSLLVKDDMKSPISGRRFLESTQGRLNLPSEVHIDLTKPKGDDRRPVYVFKQKVMGIQFIGRISTLMNAIGLAYTQSDVQWINTQIGLRLADTGRTNGETFLWMRHGLNVTAGELADLLGLPSQRIIDWENSPADEVDHAAWCTLALSLQPFQSIERRRCIKELTQWIANPPPLPETIEIDYPPRPNTGLPTP